MPFLPVQQNTVHLDRDGTTGSVGTRNVIYFASSSVEAKQVFAITSSLEIGNIEITFTSLFQATFRLTDFAQPQNAFGHSLGGGFKYHQQFFYRTISFLFSSESKLNAASLRN